MVPVFISHFCNVISNGRSLSYNSTLPNPFHVIATSRSWNTLYLFCHRTETKLNIYTCINFGEESHTPWPGVLLTNIMMMGEGWLGSNIGSYFISKKHPTFRVCLPKKLWQKPLVMRDGNQIKRLNTNKCDLIIELSKTIRLIFSFFVVTRLCFIPDTLTTHMKLHYTEYQWTGVAEDENPRGGMWSWDQTWLKNISKNRTYPRTEWASLPKYF